MIQTKRTQALLNDIEDKKHLTRHYDLVHHESLKTPITIIGAGGIGSWVTFALAKMGFENITVFDPDYVDIVNVGNQLYSFDDVGQLKVNALARTCENVGAKIRTFPSFFTQQDAIRCKGIVILAVDSMKARKMIHEAVPNNCLLIDGRMGAEKILIYSASTALQRFNYEKTLYSDENAEQAPCTAKATSYCALTIAGLITGQVKSFVQGEKTVKNLSVDAATGASIHFSH